VIEPGKSILLLGPPGSGKSTLARQALEAEGSGLIALAPGDSEFASYRMFAANDAYRIKGFDDPEFYPSAGSLKSTGYDELLGWLRGVYKSLKETTPEGEAPKYKVLVTDTFSQMSSLAMNKTLSHLGIAEAPPAMSPTGAAFWMYQRTLQEQLTRACRVIRGQGLHWISCCHVTEKEMKQTALANPDQLEEAKGKIGFVPAVSGGFRDVMAGEFDLVLHCGVMRVPNPKDAKLPAIPKHYLRWQPSANRPTKNRYGKLAESDKIAAEWTGLMERLKAIDAKDGAA
jgi:energy-coupling factor transporter ATP-binding protein EcfA2